MCWLHYSGSLKKGEPFFTKEMNVELKFRQKESNEEMKVWSMDYKASRLCKRVESNYTTYRRLYGAKTDCQICSWKWSSQIIFPVNGEQRESSCYGHGNGM